MAEPELVDDPRPPSELERVTSWRELRALRAGCTEQAALAFAAAGGAPADLERLIGRGCPPDVAADILSD